jgi:hypothetical protein
MCVTNITLTSVLSGFPLNQLTVSIAYASDVDYRQQLKADGGVAFNKHVATVGVTGLKYFNADVAAAAFALPTFLKEACGL